MTFAIGVVDLAYGTEVDVSRRAELAAADGFDHIDVLLELVADAIGAAGGLPDRLPESGRRHGARPRPRRPVRDAWDRTVRWWTAASEALCEPWAACVVQSIDDVRALTDAVPGVRFLIDTGHVTAWGGDILELLPFAGHVQAAGRESRGGPGRAGRGRCRLRGGARSTRSTRL